MLSLHYFKARSSTQQRAPARTSALCFSKSVQVNFKFCEVMADNQTYVCMHAS